MAHIENDGYVVYDEASDDDEELDTSEDDEEIFWWEFDRIEANRARNRGTTDATDFEAEMNRELDNTLSTMHSLQQRPTVSRAIGVTSDDSINAPGPSSTSSSSKTPATTEVKFYDEAYFDSDSDDSQPDGTERKKKAKHPVLSNDDLLYDPDADDNDQRWVDRRRNRLARPPPPPSSSQSQNPPTTEGNRKPLPNTDAVLNCPACMTTLCRDCQRHDVYKGQYRAMFVSNCKVDSQHTLKYPTSRNEKRKKAVRIEDLQAANPPLPPSENMIGASDVNSSSTSYNPVHCRICNTHVAVYDADEVYHFFNVLASFS